MAEKKKSLSTQLSSEPETDARPSSPLSSISSLPGGLQSDRRNHPSGAIPRTQQGTVQHDSSYSSFEDSGIQASEDHRSGSGSKLYPSGYKSIKHDNSSGQKETSLSDDELIRRYQQDLEDESLKVGYYDVMIIYCEEDREKAEAYKDHLNNDIKTKAGKHIKAVLFDDAELESLAGSKFAHLEKAFERCTFAFVYLTKEFCENDDGWCRVSSEECLMKAIYDKDKKWCVVPVYTVQRNKADFKIPMGLNALKGVNYYNNDEFYRRGLTKLLGDKLFVRENNEKMHHERVVLEIKNHIMKEKEREQRFLLKRQISEREAKQQEERHQQQIYAMAQQNQTSHRYAFPSSPVYTEFLQGQAQDPIASKQPESIPGKSTDFDESLENLRDALEHEEFKDTSRPNEEGSGEPISPPRSLEPDSPVSEPSHGKYDPSTKGIHKSQITNHLPQGHYFPVQHPQGPHLPGQHRPGQQHAPGQYPQGQHAPGQYPQDQHPPGRHPPGQYPQGQHQPGKQPHQSKLRQTREVVEIHHHHHYKQPPPPDEAEKTTQKVFNIIGAKVVQIGEGGSVVSTEGGRLVKGNVSDTDSSSDSEHQAHVKKGGVDESIPSADGCSTTQDNLTTDMHKACTTSPQLNKNKDTNTNNHNDDEQTQVKTIDEGIVGKVTAAGVVTTNEEKMVMANKMPDKNLTANKMPDKSSTATKIPEKSLESLPRSQGLSFNSMMSDKSHFPQTKIKPFSVNKLNNAKPVVSVPPMQKVSPRTNDMDNLLNNVIGGSNDRELEDPMDDTDYMNSLKRQRDQTYTGEKKISDETDEKVTYSEELETSVKRLTDSDETEVKQYYSAPEQDRNLQGHTPVAIGNQVKPGQTSVTTGNQGHNDNDQTSNIKLFNNKDATPRNNVYTKKSTNINVTSPGSSVDPEETNVLKPVSNFRLSGDLDIDGGDLESLPSSIHSSNDFTILQTYSDNLETLTNEDKEVNAVQQVLVMGFPEAHIKKCLNELQRSNPGRKHFSVPDLLDKLTLPQPEGNEGQTQVHKSATEPMLSKKSDLPSQPMSQPTSSGPHGSGSTKEKCCVS